MSKTTTTDRDTFDVTDEVDDQAAEALIARYVQQDRNRPENDRARVVVGDVGVPVWALIGHLRGVDGPAQVATDYALSLEAVVAALAYYDRHRLLIDHRLDINDAFFTT